MLKQIVCATITDMMRTIKLCFLLMLLLSTLAPMTAYGQNESGDGTEEEVNTPVPYEEDEFPQWLWSLRRFEIIAIGSFPLTYLLTLIVYDLVKFTIESVNIGAINSLYAPLFFAPSNKPPTNANRNYWSCGSGCGRLIGRGDYRFNNSRNKTEKSSGESAYRTGY